MKLSLDRWNTGPTFNQVTKRLKYAGGRPIGTANDNPILDTRMYEVEYLDGYKKVSQLTQLPKTCLPKFMLKAINTYF